MTAIRASLAPVTGSKGMLQGRTRRSSVAGPLRRTAEQVSPESIFNYARRDRNRRRCGTRSAGRGGDAPEW